MPRDGALTETVRAVPWSSGQWCCYYHDNAERLLPLPWRLGAELTDEERAAVIDSIQDFQLGEQSEGHNLLKRAAAYAERADDPEYLEAMRLFVGEEQRHAATLARFLSRANVPLLARSRLDSVFRLLRRLAGLELCISVLLTAETIGKVYYQALRRATGSVLLRRICDQLLRDEVQHIRFHAERLALLRSKRARWRVWLAHGWHWVLFGGTCLVRWVKHRRALRAGGLGLWAFWRACRLEAGRVLRLMNPRTYAQASAGPPPARRSGRRNRGAGWLHRAAGP
ncbi:MAG: ferritin-like domain-containing protein [Gemmataceae bacterium]|nr:ferritin-like domain-containing protein [Gemmataceae bacterium]